jgi:hypothetical protein
MIVHVLAGTVALVSGAAALSSPKGGLVHLRAGRVFFFAMMVMTLTGTMLAVLKPSLISAQGGTIALYLVLTSWVTARHRNGEAGAFERVAFGFAISCVVLGLLFAWAALRPTVRIDGVPWFGYIPFSALAAVCAGLDLNFILRHRLRPQQRIARHLWRMSAGLLIAVMSFFIGQQKVMPVSFRGSPVLFLPPLAVAGTMVYWLVRIRFGGAVRGCLAAVFSRGGAVVPIPGGN